MLLKKIVVAEDDDSIAHMVSMALGDAGYLCIRARDGAEAVQLTKMHQPDLLVLDVMMPRMDGREVATKLKEDVLLSKIPILMLTALADVESKIQGLDSGADDYMGKPFDLRELAARIRALIRANQRERDRNGTTDLPGSVGVDQHIQTILSAGDGRIVIQIGVAGFGAFVATAGLPASVAFIKSLANYLITEMRAQDAGFLGHLGGTDFIASCPADKLTALLDAVVAGFDKKSRAWAGESVASLKLVVGAASTTGLSDDGELAQRLSQTSRESRASEGSNYVVYAEKA